MHFCLIYFVICFVFQTYCSVRCGDCTYSDQDDLRARAYVEPEDEELKLSRSTAQGGSRGDMESQLKGVSKM